MQQKSLDFGLCRPYNEFCAMQQSELASEGNSGGKGAPGRSGAASGFDNPVGCRPVN
jgi:hypothetical protein